MLIWYYPHLSTTMICLCPRSYNRQNPQLLTLYWKFSCSRLSTASFSLSKKINLDKETLLNFLPSSSGSCLSIQVNWKIIVPTGINLCSNSYLNPTNLTALNATTQTAYFLSSVHFQNEKQLRDSEFSKDVITSFVWCLQSRSGVTQLYLLSYLWNMGLGILITVVVGLIVSFLTGICSLKSVRRCV